GFWREKLQLQTVQFSGIRSDDQRPSVVRGVRLAADRGRGHQISPPHQQPEPIGIMPKSLGGWPGQDITAPGAACGHDGAVFCW
ncbi:hypothetical protein, partial [Ancylobacter vacuolatus]|uniref:hypothetical protein n=1 Tax=Ancylobacter vacuolatus TaxID=223389 RepID=UPI003629BF56